MTTQLSEAGLAGLGAGPRIKPDIIRGLREWAEFERDGGNVEQGTAIDIILDWYDRQISEGALYAHPSSGDGAEGVRDRQALADKIRLAVVSCPHTITADEVVLRHSDKAPGNALNQLGQRILSALEPLPKTEREDAEGWIEWKGGECPVGPDDPHQRKYRDGMIGQWITTRKHGVGDYWDHRGLPGDIIAYRIHSLIGKEAGE